MDVGSKSEKHQTAQKKSETAILTSDCVNALFVTVTETEYEAALIVLRQRGCRTFQDCSIRSKTDGSVILPCVITYYTLNELVIKIAVTKQIEMGMRATMTLAMALQKAVQADAVSPQAFVAMIGVCAGRENETNLGDILVPWKIAVESGKDTPDGHQPAADLTSLAQSMQLAVLQTENTCKLQPLWLSNYLPEDIQGTPSPMFLLDAILDILQRSEEGIELQVLHGNLLKHYFNRSSKSITNAVIREALMKQIKLGYVAEIAKAANTRGCFKITSKGIELILQLQQHGHFPRVDSLYPDIRHEPTMQGPTVRTEMTDKDWSTLAHRVGQRKLIGYDMEGYTFLSSVPSENNRLFVKVVSDLATDEYKMNYYQTFASCVATAFAVHVLENNPNLASLTQRHTGRLFCGDDLKSKRKDIFPVELEIRNFPYICGRDTIITKLSHYFWEGEAENVEKSDIDNFRLMVTKQCICAQGGAGKSCVAAYYARLLRKTYTGGVFFISSRTSASIRQSFQKYIPLLSSEKEDVVSRQSLDELNALFLRLVNQRRGNALLIYDSGDDLKLMQDVVPSSAMKVHVIITTRCKDDVLMKEGNVIQLPQLDEDAAVESFCRWAGKREDEDKMLQTDLDDVRRIVNDRKVKLLPLAIRRVATFTKQTGVTCSEMSERLKRDAVRFTPDDLKDILRGCGLQHLHGKLTSFDIVRTEQFVCADVVPLANSCDISSIDEEKLKNMQDRLRVDMETLMHWDLDLEEVTRRSKDAKKILNFASLMGNSAIPTDVFRHALLRDILLSDVEIELRRSLRLLSDGFSLLTIIDEECTCDIHALVQQSVQSHMKRRDELLPHIISLSTCLKHMLPQSDHAIRGNLNNSKLIALAPHVYSVCAHILRLQSTHPHCLTLLKLSCWLAKQFHDITTAKHLAEERLQIYRQLSSRGIHDAIELSSSLFAVGDAYNLMSRPDMSKPYYEEAVQVLQAFGEDNSLPMLYGVALDRLAMCYTYMNKFEDGERMFRKELQWRRERGADDATISDVLHNLALTYEQWGKPAEAIQAYEESLELIRKCTDENSTGTSTTLMNLGKCYRDTGKFEKSASLLEKAVAISRSCYSSSHPHLARAIYHLSVTYSLLDKKDEALQRAREALNIGKLSLPSSHPHLAEYMNCVGNCCRSRGDCDEAISWHEKAGDILEQLEPSPQRDRLLANNVYCLSRDYDEKGNSEAAAELCLQIKEMNEKRPFLDCVHLAIGMIHLGSCESKAGRLEESISHLQYALSVLQDASPTSFHAADCHFFLASAFLTLKDRFRSSQHVDRCLLIRNNIFPVGHSKIEEAERLKREIEKLQ